VKLPMLCNDESHTAVDLVQVVAVTKYKRYMIAVYLDCRDDPLVLKYDGPPSRDASYSDLVRSFLSL
jgi:hypothetical protein